MVPTRISPQGPINRFKSKARLNFPDPVNSTPSLHKQNGVKKKKNDYVLNYFQGQRFKSKYPQNSAWHNSNFFWKFFSKPFLITDFRVIENSIILEYMLDKRIQQLKTIGVYTPKPKPNNVLIVIQKWDRLKKWKELPWFNVNPH